MKTLQVPRWLRNLTLGIIALIWISPGEIKAESRGGVSFQVFYDELMPYGDWVKDARYGYVWLPAVYEDFHPYGTNGHWVMTGYGNTWVSDYDWGWATFHYGRWYFDTNYQSWAWVPDYNWGPAWVDWRSGGGYYGWAPMGPGFSINFRINIPANYWVFVPQVRFGYANVYKYYVPYGRRTHIYNQTTIINNTVVYNNNHYYGGPSQREVERVTNRSYPERRVVSSNSAGRTVASRTAVSAYRPDLQSARGTTEAARPSRTLSSGEARTQPSARPSRSAGRSEAVSGRSTNTSSGSSRSSASTPSSRNEGTSTRSASPSSSRAGSFETTPYSGSQTRTSTPSRQSQVSPGNSRSSESRTSSPTVRTAPSKQSTSRTQSPPATQKSSPARTQTAPANRTTQSRTTPSSTRSQPAQSRTQSSSPSVKSSPSRSTESRSTPNESRSSSQVKSSSSSRSSSPSTNARTSSGSSSSRSTSSRGNM
ncbi:DUF6600 domain-containing protein [Algoriphagus sp.]|uniref:DUF6600 domain-containing protein n=1 Tax=Algoriphagus sp. TaxID=1872435 RepID=UPI0032773D29